MKAVWLAKSIEGKFSENDVGVDLEFQNTP